MRRLLVPAGLLLTVLFACTEAQAVSPTEQLRGFFGAATRILDPQTGEGLEARLRAIRIIVKEIVDVPAAAQLTLGSSWSERTPAERDEFVWLFGELLERALISGIAGRIRLPDGIQVSYVGESVDGTFATVWTTIVSKSGLDLPFTYRMIERAGRWAIRDVVIDRVSVASNYRAQFSRVMQSSSYQELVRQMRARMPEMLVLPLVAPATADEMPIKPAAAPMQSSAVVWEASAPEPSSPSAREVDAEASSDSRLELELAVTQVARAVPEEIVPPTNAGPATSGDAPEVIVPRREARRQPGHLAAPRPAPAANSQSYWVQVGAFKDPEAARRLAALLVEPQASRSGRFAMVVESLAEDVLLTRVRVGPFADRWEAAAKLREIESRGYRPFIAAERD